jgi:mRNA-degrading endonuclease toxin of MazEF toxin-antitoxin module
LPYHRQPRRGEIWFIKLPTDPPDKGQRPVVIVSTDARNLHQKANTVLVVPLSTTPARAPTHIELSPVETGLGAVSTIRAEDISVVRKSSLLEPRQGLRTLSEATIRRIARGVTLAMGFADLLKV